MCRNCASIVGAGETQCAVCGAPTANQPAAPPAQRTADRETIKFAKAVLNRPYKFTIFLLIANLFVFMLMWESSGLTSEVLLQGFPEPVLVAYGAKQNYLVDAPNYQWWRFIAPMFIHVNLIHLLVNMYSLLMIGPFVEKLYGGARFIFFWVFTGIAGVVASYLTVRPDLAWGALGRFIFKSVDLPSAGASGALFGLVGVLFVFGIKFRHELPEGFKRAFGTGMIPIILINLFIGFLGRQFIDNAAHLGGLLSGAAIAIAVNYRRPGARSMITPVWRTLQILSLSVIALGAYKVIRNFNRPALPSAIPPAVPNASTLIFLNYVRAMSEVQEKVSAVIHNQDVSDAGAIAQKATEAPAPDEHATELRNRLVGILSRLVETTPAASPSPGAAREFDQKLVDEFRAWQKEYNEWLKGASRSHTGTS
ncbi:MAG TPA: rhomboid family intramembrane serine protease [Pyrinomonadaceae bacterium]|nr:rhomboid family intramembrane serine protease [Pyrinomonadaceae bacterium]